MAKRWRPANHRLPCPVHNKSVHASEGSAIAAAREVERSEGLEPGAMSWYWCAESKGWHIGHRSIRDRLRG